MREGTEIERRTAISALPFDAVLRHTYGIEEDLTAIATDAKYPIGTRVDAVNAMQDPKKVTFVMANAGDDQVKAQATWHLGAILD